MINDKTEITLLTTNQPGVLASVMMTCGRRGLLHLKNHSDKINEDKARLSVVFDGTLKCRKEALISSLEALPKILAVESTSFNNSVS